MRITVLGQSASAGNGLSDTALAWPWLMKAAIEAGISTPVELTHVSVIANGPKAVDFAMSKVEASDPDMVVLVVGSYLCSVALVSEQVRHRFGPRAHRLYLRAERRFDSKTRSSGGAPGRTNGLARRLVRRVIGARPFATVDQVASCYEEMLRRLASREGMQILVFGEPSWPGWVDEQNKGAIGAWGEVVRRARAAADLHHLPWAESNPTYALSPDRDALYQSDGVHKTVEGQRLQAVAVLEALFDPANDLLSAAPASA